MKTTRHLRLRLRLIEGALVLLLGALTTAAVATHQLLLDANNRPTGDVSFSGPHWVGTLDAARLPASVPLCNAGGLLPLAHGLSVAGGTTFDGGSIHTDGVGNFFTDYAVTAASVFTTALCAEYFFTDEGIIYSDGVGNACFGSVTVSTLDIDTLYAPPAGVTLYVSSADNRLHYLGADGTDRTLTTDP